MPLTGHADDVRGKLADVTIEDKPHDEAATSDSLERLRALSQHRDKKVRAGVSSNPATPKDILQELVADKHHVVRYAVAKRADRQAWRVALAAEDADVRVILAQRQDLDGPTIQTLVSDPDCGVRQSLATSNRRKEVIARLACDDDARVRAAAALSEVVTQRDLDMLAGDGDANVRATAAQNRRLSADMVQRLVRDRSYMVRYELLWARPERVDLAKRLLVDKTPIVADLAQDCLNPPGWMLERLAELAMAGHTSA